MYQKYVELRNLKGVTDYRVAVETGITKSTFTDWKKGRSKPKFDKLIILAKYFEVKVEFFINDIDKEKQEMECNNKKGVVK